MFGDFIIWFREKWKRFLCIHEYKEYVVNDNPVWTYKHCIKCGRRKITGPLLRRR